MNDDWIYQYKNLIEKSDSKLLSKYPELNSEYSLQYFANNGNLKKIVLGDNQELECNISYKSDDPLGDRKYEVFENVLHKYSDRVLILTTSNCFFYCRYCNRKRDWGKNKFFDLSLLPQIKKYTLDNSVCEVILSGGDPFTLSNANLEKIISEIYNWEHIVSIRIHTRAITSMPFRFFDKQLQQILSKYSEKLWIYSHIVHKDEINEYVKEAVKIIRDCKITLFNQNPVLKGINDSAKVLKELFYELLKIKIIPKYIYQLDSAIGTTHFMVTPDEILDILSKLQGHISGLAMPRYIVDLPDGHGKVPVCNQYLKGKDSEKYIFEDINGNRVDYFIK